MKRLAVLLSLAALSALAQESAAPTPAAERERERARAQALRSEAQQQQQAARQTYAQAEKDCWNTFLVSDCQKQARLTWRRAEHEAKLLEAEARRIERRIAENERAARLAQRQSEKQAEINRREAKAP